MKSGLMSRFALTVFGSALCIAMASGTPQVACAQGLNAAPILGEPSAIAEMAPSLVSNFQKVSHDIWRGAQPSSNAIEALRHDGIKTVIDLRMDGDGVDKEEQKCKQVGLGYYHYSLGFDKPDHDKLREILSIMTNPVNQPVYLHCRQGADRTGMLIGLYRRLWQDWSFDKTYDEMRQHHFKPFLFSMKHEVEVASKDLKPAATTVAVAPVPVSSARNLLAGKDRAILVSQPIQKPH